MAHGLIAPSASPWLPFCRRRYDLPRRLCGGPGAPTFPGPADNATKICTSNQRTGSRRRSGDSGRVALAVDLPVRAATEGVPDRPGECSGALSPSRAIVRGDGTPRRRADRRARAIRSGAPSRCPPTPRTGDDQ